MSAFRLLLIPLYLWLYCARENYTASIVVIAVSALTDILDGKVARHFNMVSDVGKVLDPIADKLTQTALLLSLCARYHQMLALFALFASKEIVMIVMGGIVLKRTDTINSAKWYGKMGTVVLEVSLALLILFPRMPLAAVNAIMVVCGVVLLFVLAMYLLFYVRLLHAHAVHRAPREVHWARVAVVLIWLVLITVAVIYRDSITVDAVLSYTPSNPVLAIAFLMLLYAIKGVSVVIYIGILYLVDGLLFSMPVAMAVSLAGTLVSVTVPYLLGRRLGAEGAERLAQKHPRIAELQQLQQNNDFLFSMLSRLLMFLPSDPVSFYMGAIRMRLVPYLLGCAVGFTPMIVLFTVMGDSVNNLTSPRFWVAAALLVSLTALSAVLFAIMVGRRNKKKS
jgi:cardiolipin synthase